MRYVVVLEYYLISCLLSNAGRLLVGDSRMRILIHDPQSSDTTRQVLQDGPFFLRKVFSRRRGLTKVQRQTWWFPPPSPSSACAPRTQAGVETGPGVSVKDAAARRNSVRKRAVDTASRAAPCVFARVCGRALCASAALRSPSAAWAAKGALQTPSSGRTLCASTAI